MSEHDLHIAAELPAVADHIEDRLESQYGRRAHFVCLAWSNNTVQMIANTPSELLIEVLEAYLKNLKACTLRAVPAAHRGH